MLPWEMKRGEERRGEEGREGKGNEENRLEAQCAVHPASGMDRQDLEICPSSLRCETHSPSQFDHVGRVEEVSFNFQYLQGGNLDRRIRLVRGMLVQG